jgi:hypothetical protein
MKSKDLTLIKNQMLSTMWKIKYLTKIFELNCSRESIQAVDGKFQNMTPGSAFKAQYGIDLSQLDEWTEELRRDLNE